MARGYKTSRSLGEGTLYGAVLVLQVLARACGVSYRGLEGAVGGLHLASVGAPFALIASSGSQESLAAAQLQAGSAWQDSLVLSWTSQAICSSFSCLL